MLIHSVMPRYFLENNADSPAYSTKATAFGHVTGHETPQGFQIDCIHSTNPADYLNAAHIPGSIYRETTK